MEDWNAVPLLAD